MRLPPAKTVLPGCRMVLTPSDVLERGLKLLRVRHAARTSKETLEKSFKQHYGSNTLSLAQQWYDLCTTDIPEAKLSENEVSENGFRKFLMSHNFIWDTPKNARTFATRWNQCERLSRGEPIWKWLKKIAALKKLKIVWDDNLDDDTTETYIVSVDTVDFLVYEKSTETLNVDRKQYSQKFNHGALKYEIAISIHSGKPIWISGPHRAGRNDDELFVNGGLCDKIAPGKMAVVDGVYKGAANTNKASLPNAREPKEVRRYKSRIRARHETFNGRLKYYSSLKNIFRYPPDKHQIVFDAVCTTVTYQLENGCALFVV